MGVVSEHPATEPDTAAPVWAVLNPTARRYAEARRALLRTCRQLGRPDPEILLTTATETGWAQAREAVAHGARLVIVGGGDGTVREVARALTGTGVELGILPLGTANLFAYNLGLRTLRTHAMARRALTGTARPVDVGWASWRTVVDGTVQPPTPELPFLVMAGLGHDAATVQATDRRAKSRLGWVSYLAMGARHLFRKPLQMRLSVDNTPGRRLATWTILVANAGSIPGRIDVFPGSRMDDGYLDCLEVPLRTPAQWGSIAWAGLTRHRWEATALRYSRIRTLWAVPDQPAPLHLDGDVVGDVADLRIRVQPGGLLVRTSASGPRH